MHIGEKIAHVLDIKHIKQDTIARPLGVTRQAVSQKLKSGHISEEEKNIIAAELEMTKEELEKVDPRITEAALKGIQNNHHCVVLSFELHLSDEISLDKLIHLVREIHSLNAFK